MLYYYYECQHALPHHFLDTHASIGDVKAETRKGGRESESKETVRKILKVVKPGTIKDPDRMFKDMPRDIGVMYENVGIDLGIQYQTLQNELETVQFNTLPAYRKAMKILHLWKDNTPEGELTYSALAAALEKNGLIHCADKYCYTTAMESSSGT